MGGAENPSAERDRFKVETDVRLREQELELRREEISLRRKELSHGESGFSPLVITLMTGVLTLVGAIVANHMQATASLNQERSREQSELILKAIETGNASNSAKNLIFLLDLGLITDHDGKIAALEKSPQNAPVLPAEKYASIATEAWERATTAGTWSEFDKYQQQALQGYQTALSADPANDQYMVEVASTLNRLGRYSEAIPLLKAAIAKQPNIAWYYNELCMSLRRTNKVAESSQPCQRAIYLNPSNKAFQTKLESDLIEAEKSRGQAMP